MYVNFYYKGRGGGGVIQSQRGEGGPWVQGA